MKPVNLNLQLSSLPLLFKRGQHVLISLRKPNGNFLLGAKKIYPQGISRLVGGGMEAGEEPLAATIRELAEETGVTAQPNQLELIAQINTTITTPASPEPILFTTYLFEYQLTGPAIAADDLDDLVELTPHQMAELIERYKQLPSALDPELNFAWSDYGQVYSVIHELALNHA